MPTEHTIIVGGTSGIGLATARELLRAGHRVTVTGRSERRRADARNALGPDVAAVAMDATDAAALPDAFGRIGAFDHLVLALGSGAGVGPFATVALDNVKRGFAEKVYAHVGTAQAALPFLRSTGSITFVASIAAHAAVAGAAGIGAANAAVASLVPTLAVELRPLRVNGVSPGVIDTPWWDAVPADQRRALFRDYAARTPVGRVGTPEDVARAIVFLIGNDFFTGNTLLCDGGLRFRA